MYAYQVVPKIQHLWHTVGSDKAVDVILYTQAHETMKALSSLMNIQEDTLRNLQFKKEMLEQEQMEAEKDYMVLHQGDNMTNEDNEDDHYFNFKD